jgi:hypothetical protein
VDRLDELRPYDPVPARMAKQADAADLKSAALNRAYGFESRSGHQQGSGVARRPLKPLITDELY